MQPSCWLIRETEPGEWVAIAMERHEGVLVTHDPPFIGGGQTPQAALLRVLTIVREAHPAAEDVRLALQQLRARKGHSYDKWAAQLPVTAGRLRAVLTGEEPCTLDALYAWADLLGIQEPDLRREIRLVQRARDIATGATP